MLNNSGSGEYIVNSESLGLLQMKGMWRNSEFIWKMTAGQIHSKTVKHNNKEFAGMNKIPFDSELLNRLPNLA